MLARVQFDICLFIFIILTGSQAEGQGLRQDFTISETTNYEFKQILIGEHFDIYYNPPLDSMAADVLYYSNISTKTVERYLGYRLSGKIRIYLYPDPLTHAQTKKPNPDLLRYQANSGGNTVIQQNAFDLVYKGSINQIKIDIAEGICSVLLHEMLFGGTVQEKIKYASMLQLPDWFIPGLCAYVSSPWNSGDDQVMRSLIRNNHRFQLDLLPPEEQVIAGKSLWTYMALIKGETSFQRILYLVRLTRKLENATYFIFNWNIQELIRNWQQFNVGVYSRDLKRRIPQLPEKELDPLSKIINITASGERYYLLVRRHNKYRFLFYNPLVREYKEIYKSRNYIQTSSEIFEPKVVSDGDKGAILLDRFNGRNVLNFYHKDEINRKIRLKTEGWISEFQPDTERNEGLFVTIKNGNTWLEIISLKSGEISKSVKLPHIIRDLSFDGKNRMLLFSSEDSQSGNTDIFQWFVDSSFQTARNLTETLDANEIQPFRYNNGMISFLADYNGIYNSYALNFQDLKPISLTDYQSSIYRAIQNKATGQVAEVMAGKRHLWFISETDSAVLLKPSFILPPYTYFKEKPSDNEIISIIEDILQSDSISNQATVYFQTDFPENVDFVDEDTSFENRSDMVLNPFVIPYHSFLVPKLLVTQLDNGWVNTPYASTFSLPEEILYIPLGLNFNLKLNEVSNRYSLILGSKVARNFNQFDYSVDFAWYRWKIPVKAEFFRQSRRHFRTQAGYHKMTTDFISIGAVLPINRFNNLGFSWSDRYEIHQFLSTESSSLTKNPNFRNYTGPGFYYLFDKSRQFKAGLYSGLKLKGYGQYYLNTLNGNKLSWLGLDARHGLRIFKNAYWMNRFQCEFSGGQDRVTYMLGGQENWLFADYRNTKLLREIPGYYRLASSMRGFQYNIRNGNSFALWNTEFRYRPLGHLIKWNTRSELLSNLLITTFADAGAAWYGRSPFDLKSPLNTSVIQSGSTTITHYNRKQPIVLGIGYGFRTRIFGYYLKYDKAWGYENARWSAAVNYITLGRDF